MNHHPRMGPYSGIAKRVTCAQFCGGPQTSSIGQGCSCGLRHASTSEDNYPDPEMVPGTSYTTPAAVSFIRQPNPRALPVSELFCSQGGYETAPGGS